MHITVSIQIFYLSIRLSKISLKMIGCDLFT